MSRPVGRIHEYTYDAYLAHELDSNVKHEFLDGEIYAMAGGTIEHPLIAANVIAALAPQLRSSGCLVASSDLKIRVVARNMVSYPDVTVVCGSPETDPKSRQVLLNPTLVVEVTSPSTEAWDRGDKLDHYQQIPSLREVVLVSHRERRIDVVRRHPDGWSVDTITAGAAELVAGAASLAVDDVYRDVDLRPVG